jgi:germination protein M
MRKYTLLVVIIVILGIFLTGCSILQKIGIIKPENDELRPASSVVMGEEQAKKLENKFPIHLYFANADNTKLRLEIRYIDIADTEKGVDHMASVIINELINGPTPRIGLKATIPEETKLLSVEVKAGVATVDLSKEFIDNHPGGKTAEQLTLYSVVNTLTEIGDIQKVKFTINGKPQKEYKGNFKFDASFPRNTSMISKEPPASSITSLEDSEETSTGDDEESVETDSNIENEVLE